jgi:hypothetical protein
MTSSDRGAELRDDAAAERALGQEPLGLVHADRLRQLAAEQQAGDVRDEEEPVGAEPDRQRGRRFVRVDVERADAERRDHGDEAGGQRCLDRRRRARQGRADETELRHPDGLEADLVAVERHGARPDRGTDRLIHHRERAPDDPKSVGARYAASLDEADVQPRPRQLRRDLGACTVHDAHLVLRGERERRHGRLRGDRAADLEHDARHER